MSQNLHYKHFQNTKKVNSTHNEFLLIVIEYNFEEAPIQLSLDYRPEFYINADDYRSNNLRSDIALSVRYKFN